MGVRTARKPLPGDRGGVPREPPRAAPAAWPVGLAALANAQVIRCDLLAARRRLRVALPALLGGRHRAATAELAAIAQVLPEAIAAEVRALPAARAALAFLADETGRLADDDAGHWAGAALRIAAALTGAPWLRDREPARLGPPDPAQDGECPPAMARVVALLIQGAHVVRETEALAARIRAAREAARGDASAASPSTPEPPPPSTAAPGAAEAPALAA